MLFKDNPIIKLKCVLMAARLYVVDGFPGHYYCEGCFYRVQDGAWESTRDWNGRWKKARRELLPPVLLDEERTSPVMEQAPFAQNTRPAARLRSPHTSAS